MNNQIRQTSKVIGFVIGWMLVIMYLIVPFHNIWLLYYYDILLSGYTYEQWRGFFCSDDMSSTRAMMLSGLVQILFPLIVLGSYYLNPQRGWPNYFKQFGLLIAGLLMGIGMRLLILRNILNEYVKYHNFKPGFCYTRNTIAMEEWGVGGIVIMSLTIWIYHYYKKNKTMLAG